MKTESKEAVVKTAWGIELEKPIKFSYDTLVYESFSEIPTDKLPDEKDQLAFVNMRENATARSSAQAEALTAAGIKKPDNSDPRTALANMVKILEAQKIPRVAAEQMARNLLKTPEDIKL